MDVLGYSVDLEFGVRPALKLNLSSVIFSSTSNSFLLKTDVTGVMLNETAVTLDLGDSVELKPTIVPEDTATEGADKTVTWKSSNVSVAKVDENGKVRAIAAGTATITVTATNGTADTNDDKTAECIVTVNRAEGIVVIAPEAREMTYNGKVQELVDAGMTTEGTMQYAIGRNADTTPEDGWDMVIPTAKDAGI